MKVDSSLAKNHRIFIGVAVLIFSWGLFLRFYALDHQSYWMDESFSLALADSIAQHGYPVPGSDTGSFLLNLKNSLGLRGPVYHYLLAATTLIFGHGEYAARGLSALLGGLFIVLLGWITYIWFDRRTSLLTMLFTTVNYWQIAWSRQARDYILLSCLFWLSMLCIERAVTCRSQRCLFAAIVTASLAAGVHPLGLLLFPAAIIFFLIKKSAKSSVPVIFYIVIALLVLKSTDLAVYVVQKYCGIGPSYLNHYSAFLLREYWLLLLPAPLAFLPGIKQETVNQTLFWLLLVFLFGLIVISNGIALLAYRYLFFLTPVFLVFAAQGISRLWDINKLFAGVLLVSILAMQSFTGQVVPVPQKVYALESDSRKSPFPYKCYTPQPRFKEAYAYINTLKNINLITPYPTISKLYRKDRDILALHIRLKDYPGTHTATAERYSGVPYLTFPAFAYLRQSDYDVYFLIDFFAQTRMDLLLKKLILESSTIIKVWKQPEWSDLILYKLEHRQGEAYRSGILQPGR